MLTSPLALRQEPLGRSVDVHTLGWRLSPRLCKSGVKQADGDDSQCAGHRTAPKHGRGEPYPRKGSPKGWNDVDGVRRRSAAEAVPPGPSRPCAASVDAWTGSGLPPIPLHAHPHGRATGGAGDGFVQHHDGQGDRARHPLDLLPAAPARRWLQLHERSGASSPGLKAGVSAPRMR